MHLYTITMPNTWHGFHVEIHGTKGCAMISEGGDPKFYKDWHGKESFWSPDLPANDPYQTEHDRLFKAIRENATWNEIDNGVNATFTAILGRMATETGQFVTAEEAWTSTFQYVPDVTALTLAGDSPMMPDENGNYPIPQPGKATLNNPYQK
jgi:hypothetical protein